MLSVYRDYGVVLREGRDDNYNKPGEDLSAYRVVRTGDLVLNKMKTWQGSLGISEYDGIVSPAYFVARPLTSDSSAFLHHLLRSLPLIAEYGARSKGIRPSQWDLPWDEFQNITVELPSFDKQRAIADYLDRETARIDDVIAAKQTMVSLLHERASLAFDHAMSAWGYQSPVVLDPDRERWPVPQASSIMNLSQTLVQLTNGYVGPTRDILVDDGIPYVQSLHIKSGKIDFSRRPYYVAPAWHHARPRIHLREGDVLIVQTGDIGQVAVVPPAFGPASCHALQIARVKQPLISGQYLAAYLRSPFGQASLLSRATGALHPHLEAGIKGVPVVVPPRDVQDAVVDEVDQAERQAASLTAMLDLQGTLLQERRQTLITAAVTGQLDTGEADIADAA